MIALAMIFSAFSEFLGSVYFVNKKSTRSLVTAAVGAVTNIILNFALIPLWDATGAAIATAICYNRAIIKTVVNTAVIVAQAVFMIIELPYWWIYQIAFVAFLLVFNGREVLQSVLKLVKK